MENYYKTVVKLLQENLSISSIFTEIFNVLNNMKNYNNLRGLMVCFISMSLITFQTFGQLPMVNNIQFRLIPTSPISITTAAMDTIDSPFDLLTSSDSVEVVVTFEIDSVSNTSEFNVDLGSDSVTFTLATSTYYFDDFTPGGGLTYKRVGNRVELGLGTFPMSSYFVRVRYKNLVQTASPYRLEQFIH